jgi:hypothetical protein
LPLTLFSPRLMCLALTISSGKKSSLRFINASSSRQSSVWMISSNVNDLPCVSIRARSTPHQPFLANTSEERLSPGQIVPVEIPIWPTGMFWHAGEQLRVVVAGYNLKGPMFPGMPLAPTRNKGEHIIHTGGEYDSHLLVPMIPG